jgi:hypothetical protein
MPTTQGIFFGSGCCTTIQATSFSFGLCARWRRKLDEMVGARWYQIRQTTPLRRTTLFERVIGFIDRRIRGRGHKRCIGTNRCNDRNSLFCARKKSRRKKSQAHAILPSPVAVWPPGSFCFWDAPQRGGDFLSCLRSQRSHHAAQQYACRKTFTCDLYFVRHRC